MSSARKTSRALGVRASGDEAQALLAPRATSTRKMMSYAAIAAVGATVVVATCASRASDLASVRARLGRPKSKHVSTSGLGDVPATDGSATDLPGYQPGDVTFLGCDTDDDKCLYNKVCGFTASEKASCSFDSAKRAKVKMDAQAELTKCNGGELSVLGAEVMEDLNRVFAGLCLKYANMEKFDDTTCDFSIKDLAHFTEINAAVYAATNPASACSRGAVDPKTGVAAPVVVNVPACFQNVQPNQRTVVERKYAALCADPKDCAANEMKGNLHKEVDAEFKICNTDAAIASAKEEISKAFELSCGGVDKVPQCKPDMCAFKNVYERLQQIMPQDASVIMRDMGTRTVALIHDVTTGAKVDAARLGDDDPAWAEPGHSAGFAMTGDITVDSAGDAVLLTSCGLENVMAK